MKIIKENKSNKQVTTHEVTSNVLKILQQLNNLKADMHKLNYPTDTCNLVAEFIAKFSQVISGGGPQITTEEFETTVDVVKDKPKEVADIMDDTEKKVTLTEVYSPKELMQKRKIEEAAQKHGYIIEQIVKKNSTENGLNVVEASFYITFNNVKYLPYYEIMPKIEDTLNEMGRLNEGFTQIKLIKYEKSVNNESLWVHVDVEIYSPLNEDDFTEKLVYIKMPENTSDFKYKDIIAI